MSKLDRNQFVQHVLALYQATPGTRGRIRIADRRLAEHLHDNGVGIEIIRVALLLAATRRSYRPLDAYPLQPVASLHYFVPVIQEIQQNHLALEPGYVQYLEYKIANLQEPITVTTNLRSS